MLRIRKLHLLPSKGSMWRNSKSMCRQLTESRQSLQGPIDSWFEVDVFLRIHGRGYRVIPQFEVADYHIDLVIEGMHGRLAVECDGDFWHGPERYEADMIRERMLQRCGWTFWRVRGGEFYRDPDAAMNDLWRTLDLLGIQPYSSESYSKVAQGGSGYPTAGSASGRI